MMKTKQLYKELDNILKMPNSSDDALNNFEIMRDFFNSKQITLDFDSIMSLIHHNKIINESLNIIVDNDVKQPSNHILTSFLEVYCLVNGIKNKNAIETALPNRLKAYYLEIAKYPLLDKEEEQEIARKALEGDTKARNKLICSNLRLVVSYAKFYFSMYDPMDLIQEGNCGLIKAATKFNPDKGYRFSTYALYWIKQRIQLFILKSYNKAYAPSQVRRNYKKYHKIDKEFELRNARKPTFEEMLKLANFTSKELIDVLDYDKQELISADASLTNEEDSTSFLSIIPAEDNVEEEALNRVAVTEIIDIFDKVHLTKQERTIILYRYGFIDNRTHTLEEIGQMLNFTKERIRQLEKMSLIKLRSYVNRTKYTSEEDEDEKRI